MNIRVRPAIIFFIALVTLVLGTWLRYHAYELVWSNDVIAAAAVRASREVALVEIARVLLWGGAAMLALSSGAWLFVPRVRPLIREPRVQAGTAPMSLPSTVA